MIAHISAVNMDAESSNLMEIMVFGGKRASHRIPIPWIICLTRNITTIPLSYFHEKLLINRCNCAIFLCGRCIRSNTIFGCLLYQSENRKIWRCFQNVWKITVGSSYKLLNAKAKSTDGIRPCIKQLHIFVIKHRIMCGMFRQQLDLGSIPQR